ncbi:Hypothetical protein Cp99MAT_2139 [Corynebacterium pseudotuberculosis]|nr:Hypothetical protein Cp99MAT_2139 [Corynebacterium pseudotuberculosis]
MSVRREENEQAINKNYSYIQYMLALWLVCVGVGVLFENSIVCQCTYNIFYG